MSSEVEICNLALSHVSASARIESLTENSNEAYYCNLHFQTARDAMLEAMDWGFARRYVTLADLGTPPADWSYRYAYPQDCVSARSLHNSTDRQKGYPFEVAALVESETITGRVILCDIDGAELRYTARVTTPGVFSASFVTGLSWQLAYNIAKPLTGSNQERDAAGQGLALFMAQAQVADANQSREQVSPESTWVTGRA
jgi:hypothetical protein